MRIGFNRQHCRSVKTEDRGRSQERSRSFRFIMLSILRYLARIGRRVAGRRFWEEARRSPAPDRSPGDARLLVAGRERLAHHGRRFALACAYGRGSPAPIGRRRLPRSPGCGRLPGYRRNPHDPRGLAPAGSAASGHPTHARLTEPNRASRGIKGLCRQGRPSPIRDWPRSPGYFAGACPEFGTQRRGSLPRNQRAP